MRRRADSYVNATQILKVAGVDKGRRTKILEKEILPGKHEIVQGGYGKYQGTWSVFICETCSRGDLCIVSKGYLWREDAIFLRNTVSHTCWRLYLTLSRVLLRSAVCLRNYLVLAVWVNALYLLRHPSPASVILQASYHLPFLQLPFSRALPCACSTKDGLKDSSPPPLLLITNQTSYIPLHLIISLRGHSYLSIPPRLLRRHQFSPSKGRVLKSWAIPPLRRPLFTPSCLHTQSLI